MVAVINTGQSIRGIFFYNENKVSQGCAVCIGEGNYPMDLEKMSENFKIGVFLKQLQLNENIKRSAVHISLNFDRSDTDLSKEKLMQIASSYMEKIGFGSQPYLVYQHHDAGHPHIHIASINVRADGSRINMHNIGRNQSESARKELEISFNLIRADSRKKQSPALINAIDAEKIKYGAMDSKRAISSVLNAVIPNYKYTTLGELNAVLNLYNVKAERGKENSKMFQNKGLVYQILDGNKKTVGVPIKASSFYSKPTLSQLEINFAASKTSRAVNMKRTRNAVDLLLLKYPSITLSQLETRLANQGITAVARKNENGLIYGMTYIDHNTRCVFNGSSLGPAYAAKGLLERIGGSSEFGKQSAVLDRTAKSQGSFISAAEVQRIIDDVLYAGTPSDYVPKQLKNKRKKRKRKGPSDNN
ncbi:relaxase/mobilization nuclease domain-containing protein [Flavobacterium quisquiliarum]|uniref:Relaxase/mobilization nuclease domain-containing protein n=1 Tax=Flavobacterium quisquiliarum TaxID=1834436 RepID=A0ABV8W7U2_9FLAO|nr:relaxase/mobilization nuclease domain-containing protein [Flavobacterium quisquiliarum]MBW1654963.1 relaxase/mobilization nuclease domain-containing protein [Flavobacterium quisquiliarum]MBW1655911.1 relaxase/mobilization nuclease domain-containing protein [Flavobacterium quisquiliarum]MBW1655972.1 relaxase/mobilization nuclease domain-containing protein [Flavobacterium quisquiliarum]MBW1656176.1 relaxase/mobilization nuclease domain-containing protein [Flavobacterium quisquiliarum]